MVYHRISANQIGDFFIGFCYSIGIIIYYCIFICCTCMFNTFSMISGQMFLSLEESIPIFVKIKHYEVPLSLRMNLKTKIIHPVY